MARDDMPGRKWQGPGSNRGNGYGRGRGKNWGHRPGAGVMGNCVCPNCGERLVHAAGVPCYDSICPKCGAHMTRE